MDKTLFKILLLFFISLLIIFIIVNILTGKRDQSMFAKESFNGVIVNIYADNENHGMSYIKVYTKQKDTVLISALYWPNLVHNTKIGDTLIKQENELIIKIKRKNNIIKEIPYSGINNFLTFIIIIVLIIVIILIKYFFDIPSQKGIFDS